MKKLIAAIILFASSAVYAEEAKPAAQGEAKAEAPAPEEKPLDNKALIETVERIAAVKLDKKKTDVEKDAAISTLIGKKFEITCELVKAKKNDNGTYEVIFEDKNKKVVDVYETKEESKSKSGTKYPKHFIRIVTHEGDETLAALKKGEKVTICGMVSKTPNIVGYADYKDDMKAVEIYILEKSLSLKQ